MKYKLLSTDEENTVRNMAYQYYQHIDKKDIQHQNRLFGIEVEFSITNNENKLQPGFADILSKGLASHCIVPELGSYQIEINPAPLKLENSSFHSLYQILQKSRKMLEERAKTNALEIVPIGIPFFIHDSLFQNLMQNFTQKNRYLVSAQYFGSYNKEGLSVPYKHGGSFLLPGDTGVTVINELHIQVQAKDLPDLVNLFNYSQMITAPLVCLGANSGITNGKPLKNIEQQIEVFEKSEGVYDGIADYPRVGLYPHYIRNLDEFMEVALSFKPLYFPSDSHPATAFDLMLGIYYSWTRIRYGLTPSPHYRIEFRPLSSQPTMIENMAMAEFYIKTLLFLIKNQTTLIDEEFMCYNFKAAVQHGMQAHLFWDLGDGLNKYPVHIILSTLLNNIKNGEYTSIIERRIKDHLSPTEKLIEQTNVKGYSTVISEYKHCFQKEIPYI